MKGAVKSHLMQLVHPGGGPKRIKNWMAFMLLLQVTATILPGKNIRQLSDTDLLLLSGIGSVLAVAFFLRNRRLQIPLCAILFATALVLLPVGAYYYNSGKADPVLISAWSSVFYIMERRQYVSFSQFVYGMLGMMVALAVSTCVGVLYPVAHSVNDLHLLAAGLLSVTYNCYLLIVDFRHGKHRMDFFERHFDKIDELRMSLTRILMADKPINDVMWDVTRECIPTLGLEDFVIYLYDEDKNKLVQVAAYGNKSDGLEMSVVNPLEIEPGKGIVGRVFIEKKPRLISNVSLSKDYILDDIPRASELAVPILIGARVFGVIDSEHSQEGFFNNTHVQLFNVIAAFCSIKAAQVELRDQQLEAKKMREFEQLKSRFIANISHDLKTPLSLIMGPSNQLYKTAKDQFTKQQASYIIKNADHLVTMVEQLLQLNLIEQGVEINNPETIDLVTMLNNLAQQYTPLAEEKGIIFHVTTDDYLLITADNFKLSQCVHNLLQNAFKHTPANGMIFLEAKKSSSDSIDIMVKDTGIGIHPGEQKKIFERFYKVDVNNHKGTGIGLSLVKEYVTQMNGTISVTSMPGAGASFIISLPAQTGMPQEKITVVENMTTGDEDMPLVIVVEDHEELNSFVCQSLQMEGYRCMQAFNGKEAWQLIQQYVPDLIVSDLMMPQLSGEELVGMVRSNETTSHIPMIILTAKNLVNNRVELYQTGADNYIPKPFKMEELLAVIDNTLTQRKRVMDKFYKAYLDNSVPAATTTIIDDQNDEAPVNDTVQLCTDYVLAHLEDPDLNVNTLGAAMGMGRNRLQKEIKAGTSLTPVEFIRSIRLHQAYKLLLEAPQYNISEIAYKTGFSNLSYFSRSFKMQFGIAPTNMNRKIIQ